MPDLLTHSEMAARFTSAGNKSADAARYLRQLRHLEAQRRIKPHALPRDGRGTSQFENFEVCAARVFIAAMEAGITGESLTMLDSEIRHGFRRTYATADLEVNLEANLPRILAGEMWAIECTGRRDPETGAIQFSPHWVRIQDDGRVNRFGDLYPDPLTTTSYADGMPVEYVVTLPVTALVRPLLDGAA